jgi:hypothetical protein
MNERAIPASILVPWRDLLLRRALLHEHLKSFKGKEDFVAKATSARLHDRRDAAALERFAEQVFNVYADLAAELMLTLRPQERAAIRDLSTEGVLVGLRVAGILTVALFEDLNAIREARNSWQHGASFVPAAAVWRGAIETEGNIDKAIAALQLAFERMDYRLGLDFPDLEPAV